MTFRESEFPDILNRIDEILESQKDPMVAVQLIREIVDNYKEIPLYPGIVNGVSYSLIESAELDGIERGDFVAIEEDDRHVTGQVESIEDGTVTLTNAIECSWKNESDSEARDIEAIQKLTLGALEREWPELIFENDAGVTN